MANQIGGFFKSFPHEDALKDAAQIRKPKAEVA